MEPDQYIQRLVTSPLYSVLPQQSQLSTVGDAWATTPNAALYSIQSMMERANVPMPGTNTTGHGQISLGLLAIIVIAIAASAYWFRGYLA
jgi:hypothetical protein